MARTAFQQVERSAFASVAHERAADRPADIAGRAPAVASTVFVLDDEESVLFFLGKILTDCGLGASTFSDVPAFHSALAVRHPDFVIVDLALRAEDGIGVLGHLASIGYRGRIVLISGIDERVLDAAVRFGTERGLDVAGRLQKPFDLPRLRAFLLSNQLVPLPIKDADVHKAFAAGQLFHVFQPKVDLRSCRVVGGEALVRWAHPVAGVLAPDRFLPQLSRDGIHELTHGLLTQVFKQMRAWESDGISCEMSVNVPASLICEPSFYDWFKDLRQSTGACSPVTLEVTETDACVSELDACINIARFRLLGLAIAVDDFGIGYSSLARLRYLPISELKIDRKFVTNLAHDKIDQVIVKSIMVLAQGMRLKVTAEGVEDPAALDHLRELGCDYAQGFHISRPLPIDAFARMVRPDSAAPISSAPFPVA